MQSLPTQEIFTDIYKPIISWKQADADDLIAALQKIKTRSIKPEDIPKIKQTIFSFHKQLISAGNIQDKILELVFETKAHIKKLEEKVKNKQLPVVPKLQKTISVSDIEVPKDYGSALPPNRKTMLGNLYKHFLFEFKEHQQHPSLEDFIVDVERAMFKNSRGRIDAYNQDVKKICLQFVNENSKSAKVRMLAGDVLAENVAMNKSQAFLTDEARLKIQQNIKEEAIYANIHFFDEHRRKIHSGSSEECRFCRSKAAYCWSMKQMRAADQPMTRFMKCQKCDKSWKD